MQIRNQISNISEGVFKGLSNTQHLDIVSIQISDISGASFQVLVNATCLLFDGVRFNSLDEFIHRND